MSKVTYEFLVGRQQVLLDFFEHLLGFCMCRKSFIFDLSLFETFTRNFCQEEMHINHKKISLLPYCTRSIDTYYLNACLRVNCFIFNNVLEFQCNSIFLFVNNSSIWRKQFIWKINLINFSAWAIASFMVERSKNNKEIRLLTIFE